MKGKLSDMQNAPQRPAMEPPPPTTDEAWKKAFGAFKDVVAEADSLITLRHFMTLIPEDRMDVLAILRDLKAAYALVDRLKRERREEGDDRLD
jgi:hypothetical protein